MHILALDVGTKRIGCAYAPSGTTIVLPLEPIDCTKRRADIRAVCTIIREREIGIVVIGDPLTLTGQRALASEFIDKFVDDLRYAWPGDIRRMDERLTTAQSERTLIDADVSRAKRKRLIDGMAAGLLLESFLARNSPKPSIL